MQDIVDRASNEKSAFITSFSHGQEKENLSKNVQFQLLKTQEEENYHETLNKERSKLYFKNFFSCFSLFIAVVVGIQIGMESKKNNNFSKKINFTQGVVVSNSRFYKKTIFNQENAYKPLNRNQKFYINLTEFLPNISHSLKSLFSWETKESNDTINILTPNQLDKIVDKINFEKLKQDILDSISYELIQFQKDERISQTLPLFHYQHFKNQTEIEEYLNNLTKKAKVQKRLSPQSIKFQLSRELMKKQVPRQAIEAEYYLADKNYKISEAKYQRRFCFITPGYNLVIRNQYKQFFQQMEKINYTNYHIVYIDDNSKDNLSDIVYDYLKNSTFKAKNHIRIVHTLQSTGLIASYFFWINKLCADDDIVVLADADDAMIGIQTLQILNKLYQDPNMWYIYANFVHFDQTSKIQYMGQTNGPLGINTNEYRKSGKWMTSHLKTHVAKVFKLVPVYQLIEYHYDSKTGIGWPTFQFHSADVSCIYSILELAGNKRQMYIQEYFYKYYSGAHLTRRCYNFMQRHDLVKNRLKRPLSLLNSLKDKAARSEGYNTLSNETLKELININSEGIKNKCYQE